MGYFTERVSGVLTLLVFVVAPGKPLGIAGFAFAPFTRQCAFSSREHCNQNPLVLKMTDQIVSPFDRSDDNTDDPYAPPGATTTTADDDEFLELTWDNVEKVLDGMRPYLVQDGGNVVISDIDGPVVYLELQVCFLFMQAHSLLIYSAPHFLKIFFMLREHAAPVQVPP